jgi:hypothetical protein
MFSEISDWPKVINDVDKQQLQVMVIVFNATLMNILVLS